MMRNAVLSAVALGTLGIFACSCGNGGTAGTGGSGGHTSTSSSSTTSTGVSTHMNKCVLTTDKGNTNGVGAYCTPGGGECSKFPLAGLCLADLAQTEWFCTRIGCKTDADCGDMAVCHLDPGGSACVPSKCEPPKPDGGTDGDGGDGGKSDGG